MITAKLADVGLGRRRRAERRATFLHAGEVRLDAGESSGCCLAEWACRCIMWRSRWPASRTPSGSPPPRGLRRLQRMGPDLRHYLLLTAFSEGEEVVDEKQGRDCAGGASHCSFESTGSADWVQINLLIRERELAM